MGKPVVSSARLSTLAVVLRLIAVGLSGPPWRAGAELSRGIPWSGGVGSGVQTSRSRCRVLGGAAVPSALDVFVAAISTPALSAHSLFQTQEQTRSHHANGAQITPGLVARFLTPSAAAANNSLPIALTESPAQGLSTLVSSNTQLHSSAERLGGDTGMLTPLASPMLRNTLPQMRNPNAAALPQLAPHRNSALRGVAPKPQTGLAAPSRPLCSSPSEILALPVSSSSNSSLSSPSPGASNGLADGFILDQTIALLAGLSAAQLQSQHSQQQELQWQQQVSQLQMQLQLQVQLSEQLRQQVALQQQLQAAALANQAIMQQQKRFQATVPSPLLMAQKQQQAMYNPEITMGTGLESLTSSGSYEQAALSGPIPLQPPHTVKAKRQQPELRSDAKPCEVLGSSSSTSAKRKRPMQPESSSDIAATVGLEGHTGTEIGGRSTGQRDSEAESGSAGEEHELAPGSRLERKPLPTERTVSGSSCHQVGREQQT
jgi:hypothetical protein